MNLSFQALFNRLCPSIKGVRSFSPVMLNRLRKLGIDKNNPDDLTPEEVNKFVRLNIHPDSITWFVYNIFMQKKGIGDGEDFFFNFKLHSIQA